MRLLQILIDFRVFLLVSRIMKPFIRFILCFRFLSFIIFSLGNFSNETPRFENFKFVLLVSSLLKF